MIRRWLPLAWWLVACNGAAPLTDLDGDGFEAPVDCDDRAPNVRPGLAEIVGDEAVHKFAFYDDVDYDALVVSLVVTEAGSMVETLRDIRKIAQIPLAQAKHALSKRELLHETRLVDWPGPLERRRAIVTMQKLKQAIAQHGGNATIDLSSPDGTFRRVDCSDQELNYVITPVNHPSWNSQRMVID